MRHARERYQWGTNDLYELRTELADLVDEQRARERRIRRVIVQAVDNGLSMIQLAGILDVSKATAHRRYYEAKHLVDAERLIDETAAIARTSAETIGVDE